MTFKLPTTDQLREIGENLGMDFTEDYAKSLIGFMAPLGDGYRSCWRCPTTFRR